jgi:eukaryotic-like serine/threonine-protein kinase
MATTRGQHLIGKVIGSCVLERLLGYGGSSAVFLAQQQHPERKVAVKVFLPRPNMDTQTRREFYHRFLREAEAASQLDHPNILPIYSYGEQDGLPYIIMPYMPGGTLSEYVAKHGPLSLPEAQWYLEQITLALDYAHQHNCVHCDVKPANILIDSDGHVVLSDFGIARILPNNVATEAARVRSSDALMGTPDYISPEQAMGYAIDGRADIYSLGVTLFYLLAGYLPFRSDTTIALALQHIHEAPPLLAAIREDVTPTIDMVVDKALAKEPDARFQTPVAFSAAFAQAVAESEKQTSSGKRLRILAAAGALSGAPHLAPVARDAVAQTARAGLGKGRVRTFRLVTVASLALAIVLATVLAGNVLFVPQKGNKPVSTQISLASTSTLSEATPNTSTSGTDNLLANKDDWPISRTFFYDTQQQRYHILNKLQNDAAMLAMCQNHQFSDFDLTVTMTQIRSSHNGEDYYGVVFRSSSDQSHYYLFEVLSSTDDGQFVFLRYDNQAVTLATGAAPSLHTKVGNTNKVTIKAQGNQFKFYINGKQVGGTISDPAKSPLKSGQVGLYVEDKGVEVAFSELYITTYSRNAR